MYSTTKYVNGMKYIPTPKSRAEWTQSSSYGSKHNMKKLVLRFVEAISEYDDMTRDMYYPQMLIDNSAVEEIESNTKLIKKIVRRIKA